MGIGNYNDESIHDQRSLFLPMFCRLSIKDVRSNTVSISTAEPSSPRVSCMGQVKRNNRVTGYPATATIIAAAHHHKHTKHRKLHFSTKTLLPNPNPATATATAPSAGRKSGSRSCRGNREMSVRESRTRRSVVTKSNYDLFGDQDCVKVVVDITKMDPPLPVVKRAPPPPGNCRDEVNLWKRRSNGVKTMQIEPINLPGRKFQPPPTTV